MRELTEQEKAVHTVLSNKLKLSPVEKVHGASLTRKMDRYVVDDPVVYKVLGTDTFIVFGAIGSGYNIRRMREQIAKLQTMQEKAESDTAISPGGDSVTQEHSIEPVAVEDVSEEYVDLVVSQASVSREEAREVLARCGNDVIEALSKLSE